MSKGKSRNPWFVLFMTIITGGIYFLYWLVINPVEIKRGFNFEKGENQFKLIFIFMAIGALLTLLFTIVAIMDSLDYNFEKTFLYSTLYTLCMVFVGAFLFYYLCSLTKLAQQKAKIEPFEMMTVFGVYLLNLLIEAGSDLLVLSQKFYKNLPTSSADSKSIDMDNISQILPLLGMNGIINLLGLLLFFLFIYLLQKQYNRIWEEGVFEEAEIV